MTNYLYLLTTFGLTKGQATCGSGQTCDTGLPTANADGGQLTTALEIVFGVAAALAVLMIVIAGFRFITAQGNSQEISKAKSTIVYALVGLLVALTAEAIVALVLGKL